MQWYSAVSTATVALATVLSPPASPGCLSWGVPGQLLPTVGVAFTRSWCQREIHMWHAPPPPSFKSAWYSVCPFIDTLCFIFIYLFSSHGSLESRVDRHGISKSLLLALFALPEPVKESCSFCDMLLCLSPVLDFPVLWVSPYSSDISSKWASWPRLQSSRCLDGHNSWYSGSYLELK